MSRKTNNPSRMPVLSLILCFVAGAAFIYSGAVDGIIPPPPETTVTAQAITVPVPEKPEKFLTNKIPSNPAVPEKKRDKKQEAADVTLTEKATPTPQSVSSRTASDKRSTKESSHLAQADKKIAKNTEFIRKKAQTIYDIQMQAAQILE